MAIEEWYDWYQQFREENQRQIMEYRRETQQWIASLKQTTEAQEETRLETNQSFETLCELIRGMTKKETTPPVVLEDSVTSSERNHSRIPQEDDRGHPTEDSQVTRDNVFVVKIKENATPSSTNRELEVPAGSVLRTLQPELVNENEGEPELVSDEQITNSSQEINSNLHIVQEKSKGLQHHCESSKVIPPPLQDVVAEVASKELGKLVQLLIELIEIRLANGRTSSMIDIGLCPMEFLEPYDAHKLFVEIPREESLLQMAFVKGKICMAKEMRLIVGVDRGSPYLISFDPGGNNHCCLSVVQEIGNRDEIIGISLEEHHVRDGPIMGQSLADQEFDLKSLKNGLKLLPYDRGITSIDVIDIQLRPSMAFVFDPGKCSVVQTMEQGLKMMRRNSKSMLHHLLLVMKICCVIGSIWVFDPGGKVDGVGRSTGSAVAFGI